MITAVRSMTALTAATWLLPAVGSAADAAPPAAGLAWQLLWALVFVIGIILLLYALARRRFPSLRPGGAITVLEVRYLMPRKAVALIKVHGQHLLLGLGGDRVELLSNLPPPESERPDFSRELDKHGHHGR